MLKQFYVKNYKNLCIEEPLSFGNLNIFIGPNGSGKTNLFQAMKFLTDAIQNGIPFAVKERKGWASVLNKKSFPGNIFFSWIFPPLEGISLTQRIAQDNNEWTQERVFARQKWLAKQATAIWRIAELGETR